MPNGDRQPYRVGAHSPSPDHTSDSDDTWEHKRRYWSHALRVRHRWRRHVGRARRARLLSFRILFRGNSAALWISCGASSSFLGTFLRGGCCGPELGHVLGVGLTITMTLIRATTLNEMIDDATRGLIGCQKYELTAKVIPYNCRSCKHEVLESAMGSHDMLFAFPAG